MKTFKRKCSVVLDDATMTINARNKLEADEKARNNEYDQINWRDATLKKVKLSKEQPTP